MHVQWELALETLKGPGAAKFGQPRVSMVPSEASRPPGGLPMEALQVSRGPGGSCLSEE